MVDHPSWHAWRAQTTAHFALHLFTGGHFFLQTAQVPFLAAVAQALATGGARADLP